MIVNPTIPKTLGNKDWLNQNEEALRQLFPETWTHVSNLNIVGILYHLKLMGIDYLEEDMNGLLNFFIETGVVICKDHQFRRSTKPVEFEKVFSNKRQRAVTPETQQNVVNSALAMTDSIIKNLMWALMLFGWLGGFVLAKGFFSTLSCIIPFWAWYLCIEKLFQAWGWV